MLRNILKGILIIIIVAAVVWGVGFLLVLVNFGPAPAIGALLQKIAVGVGIIAGLWWWINGGWTWGPGRN